MIEVCVRSDGVGINGHAGFAAAGKDIVCAGVTALVQTLLLSLESLTDDKVQYDISPGKADIYYRDLSKSGKLLMDSFFIGIQEISSEFPQYVQITGPERR